MSTHNGLIDWNPADVEVKDLTIVDWMLATEPPLTGWEDTQPMELI